MTKNRAQIDLMLKQGKSNARILMNTSLIVVAFAVFTLIVALQSQLLIVHNILALELVLAIPFLLTSTFANSKLTYTRHEKHWDNLGWITFILGYGFLINVAGILVYILIGAFPAAVFFAVNILLTLIYSGVELSYNRTAMARRLSKDLIFIIILFVFGILPILAI